ncbi:hypothetical protein D3C87_686420 [compost metagenome]
MSKQIGKGFQVLSINGDQSIEVLYWVAPNNACFSSLERQFDAINFDKPGQAWHLCDGCPAEAVFIGNYAKPEAVNAAQASA